MEMGMEIEIEMEKIKEDHTLSWVFPNAISGIQHRDSRDCRCAGNGPFL